MQNLLVTLVGPQKTSDLELPGDIPIDDLLPYLFALCGTRASASSEEPDLAAWCLRIEAHPEALPRAHSLIDAGVQDGDMLYLQPLTAISALPVPEKQFQPKAILPGPSTGGIGVAWDKDGLLS